MPLLANTARFVAEKPSNKRGGVGVKLRDYMGTRTRKAKKPRQAVQPREWIENPSGPKTCSPQTTNILCRLNDAAQSDEIKNLPATIWYLLTPQGTQLAMDALNSNSLFDMASFCLRNANRGVLYDFFVTVVKVKLFMEIDQLVPFVRCLFQYIHNKPTAFSRQERTRPSRNYMKN